MLVKCFTWIISLPRLNFVTSQAILLLGRCFESIWRKLINKVACIFSSAFRNPLQASWERKLGKGWDGREASAFVHGTTPSLSSPHIPLGSQERQSLKTPFPYPTCSWSPTHSCGARLWLNGGCRSLGQVIPTVKFSVSPEASLLLLVSSYWPW